MTAAIAGNDPPDGAFAPSGSLSTLEVRRDGRVLAKQAGRGEDSVLPRKTWSVPVFRHQNLSANARDDRPRHGRPNPVTLLATPARLNSLHHSGRIS
jgi:hypothetical protein